MTAASVARGLATAANTGLVVTYPLVVYFGLTHFTARDVGLLVAALVLVGLPFRLRGKKREHVAALLPIPATVVGVALLGAAFDSPRLVLALPVLTNVGLLLHFAGSLRGTPIVERFARAMEDDLSPAQVAYCRSVTKVWSAFFVLNGLTITLLAIAAPLTWWAFYAGFASYGLVGAVATIEYVVRKYRFRKYGPGIQDRVLALVFPP